MSVYLDTNVFLLARFGNDDDARTVAARRIIRDVAQGREDSYTSTLTVDEAVWVVLCQKKNRSLAIDVGLRLHDLPVKMIALTEEISRESLHLLERYPALKPRDAVHAASCISEGATEIVSDDADFDVVTELRRRPLK